MNFRLRHKARKLLSRYGIGRGKGHDLATATATGMSLAKLHLGCGNIHIDGWCNVDIIKTGATDLVLDIAELPSLPDGTVSTIYSCHVLEHFATSRIPDILARWHAVLRPGGELRVSVPDLDRITAIYQRNLAHMQRPGNQPWIALIYGGQKDEHDFHKTGFNFNWLGHLLRQAGFQDVRQYPHAPHFIEGVVDNSLADAPFGDYISLNVRATKK